MKRICLQDRLKEKALHNLYRITGEESKRALIHFLGKGRERKKGQRRGALLCVEYYRGGTWRRKMSQMCLCEKKWQAGGQRKELRTI